jgi:hypothetical protein
LNTTPVMAFTFGTSSCILLRFREQVSIIKN